MEYVVLVTGDREWTDSILIWAVLNCLKEKHGHKLVLVQGGARGADTHAMLWAENHKVDMITRWAHWDEHGKAAGPIRNHLMHDAHKPNLVLAFHPNLFGGSKGTYEMYQYAKRNGTLVRHFTGEEDLEQCVQYLP